MLCPPLFQYLELFEEALKEASQHLCLDLELQKIIQYSLFSGGKRFRPLIVCAVADCLSSVESCIPSALAVEYFHTSSLIADDLPAMDNDDYRRGKLSLHKMFDETSALLASYGLISAAFSEIERNSRISLEGHLALPFAIQVATRCSGFSGATLGQYWDIKLSLPTLKEIESVIYHKTITLFEVSFCLGWLFAGGSLSLLEEVKALSFDFGMAFQIRDDLLDLQHDLNAPSTMNIAVHLGKDLSQNKMDKHLNRFLDRLKKLKLASTDLKDLAEMIRA
jgi:geranylgeranyl diphosphate synthase type II